MRTLLLTGVAFVLLAGSTVANAADVYIPAPGYGAAPPPPPVYRPGPLVEAVPHFEEAPPPAYAPLPPPLAYPAPQQYGYGPEGYGPQPGYVYDGPPVVAYGPGAYRECWVEWGHRRCVLRNGW